MSGIAHESLQMEADGVHQPVEQADSKRNGTRAAQAAERKGLWTNTADQFQVLPASGAK